MITRPGLRKPRIGTLWKIKTNWWSSASSLFSLDNCINNDVWKLCDYKLSWEHSNILSWEHVRIFRVGYVRTCIWLIRSMMPISMEVLLMANFFVFSMTLLLILGITFFFMYCFTVGWIGMGTAVGWTGSADVFQIGIKC